MTQKPKKIMTYRYTAEDRRGRKIKGAINAGSISLAKAELRNQGVIPIKVRKKSQSLFGASNKSIKPKDIAVFSRQMATMMKSGVALIQSFEIVGKGHENKNMQQLLMNIKTEIESGVSFADALSKHPKYFDRLYIGLIRAGEQSGTLEAMLDRVATYKEKTESLKSKVKKAMFYPISVVVVAIIVTSILLLWVVPQFEDLFESFGADLPVFTLFVISISELLQQYWWICLGLLGLTAFIFRHLKLHSYKFNLALDTVLLKLPIVGDIFDKSAIARYARTLSTTIAAGMPLLDCLNTVANATGNLVYTRAVYQIKDMLETGQQLQLAMRSTDLFPNMVVQMVSIGEEAGSLEDMLGKVADFYEEEVDHKVDGLSSLLEPVIIVILGTLIGGLIVAMYLPIFQMGNAIG